MAAVLIDTEALPLFEREQIHDPRPRSLFNGPLLIVHKSPPAGKMRIQVGLAMRDIVFNQSYYGYGAKTHAARATVAAGFLPLANKLALWLALLTSGEFRFSERDTLRNPAINKSLVPDFDTLTKDDWTKRDGLFDHLCAVNDEEAWTKVDAWLATFTAFTRATFRSSMTLYVSTCRSQPAVPLHAIGQRNSR